MKLTTLVLLTAAFLPLVWQGADSPKEFSPGNHWLTLQVGGRERTCLLHLPPVYDGKRSLPLVIVLHGGGGNDEPTREVAATDVMWEFFAKHPKRRAN